MGGLPFHYWGSMNALVAQMINFVGEVPIEWQQTWDEIQLASNFAPVKSKQLFKHGPWTRQGYRYGPTRMFGRAYIRAGASHLSKLEQTFNEKVSEESLKPLLPVIQDLMRLIPSHRISASQALDLVRISRQILADESTTSD